MIEFYLDVDGVVLDFEGAFVDFVREKFLPDLPADYVLQTWEISQEFSSLDIERVWGQFVNSERFSQMKLLLDREEFNRIASVFPLYLVTNIPKAQFQSREENLKLHHLHYTELHLVGHFNFGDKNYPSKSQVIQALHRPGHELVFLDDHPKNCDEIKTCFPHSHVYLMERPHNQKVEDRSWIRVADWNVFYRSVSQLIDRTKKN